MDSRPQRVQRTRKAGQRGIPEGAVYVGRPSRWGNPWSVGVIGNKIDGAGGPAWGVYGPQVFTKTHDRAAAQALAVEIFRSWLLTGSLHGLVNRAHVSGDLMFIRSRIFADITELCGRDLACWCPLDTPCHATVLLDYVNTRRLSVDSPATTAAARAVIAEVLWDQWVPSRIVYGTEEPIGFDSRRDWAEYVAEVVLAALNLAEERVTRNEYAALNGAAPDVAVRLVGPWQEQP